MFGQPKTSLFSGMAKDKKAEKETPKEKSKEKGKEEPKSSPEIQRVTITKADNGFVVQHHMDGGVYGSPAEVMKHPPKDHVTKSLHGVHKHLKQVFHMKDEPPDDGADTTGEGGD